METKPGYKTTEAVGVGAFLAAVGVVLASPSAYAEGVQVAALYAGAIAVVGYTVARTWKKAGGAS